LPLDLNRGVFRSTFLQIGGRVVLALARLVVASLIVRVFGAGRYGEYALVLVLTALPEWILDFGLNDIFVREICQRPSERHRLLTALTTTKLFQVAVAYPVLIVALIALRYPMPVVRSGLIAGTGLLFYGATLVFRALFKAELRLEMDILAEAAGVAVMLPLVWLACRAGAPLEVLVLCYVVSRAVYLAVAAQIGASGFRLNVHGVVWEDVRWGLGQAAPIGVAGLMVGIYESLDALTLSKMVPTSELGLYTGAQRILSAVLMGLGAVSLSLFPVLSAYFKHEPERFRRYLQGGVDAVVLLAAALLSGLAAGAEFLLGLIGPQMVPAGSIFRILCVACLIKAVSMTLGPVLYVTGAQAYAVRLTGCALATKCVLLLLLVPRWGGLGAATSSLTAELVGALLPTVLVVQHFAQSRLRWTHTAKVVLAVAIAQVACYALGMEGTFTGGLVAGSLLVGLAVAGGAFRPSEFLSLLPVGARERAL
jgi:O-antigen/teichoic acid export membrane protein